MPINPGDLIHTIRDGKRTFAAKHIPECDGCKWGFPCCPQTCGNWKIMDEDGKMTDQKPTKKIKGKIVK